MFLEKQDKSQFDYYAKMLQIVGSLSKLFSESSEPYIQYRVAENLFCASFDAENLSRTDCSADASKNHVGIGIKTFLDKNGATLQKIAEFNKEYTPFSDSKIDDFIYKIAMLRNERLETTKRIFGLEDLIYHCVTRRKDGISVFEKPMSLINLDTIQNISRHKNNISFHDKLNEYAFNISKSTLYKRFHSSDVLLDVPVNIIEDPFALLSQLTNNLNEVLLVSKTKSQEHLYLPLYSFAHQGEKIVPEKSGLNQWNASGRQRNINEVYIQIPSWIHRSFPHFFPSRDTPFTLILPNKNKMSAKVCQENSKALMSNPNADLGTWILRDVLGLKEGELLTYEKLSNLGFDSVVMYKIHDAVFDIDFTKSGSYDMFYQRYKI